MAKNKKFHCKDCVMSNDDSPEFPYCMGKDLYTCANPENETCEDVELMVFTCKDCIFFNNGTCKEEKYGRDVDAEDNVCTTFEYKKEFKI